VLPLAAEIESTLALKPGLEMSHGAHAPVSPAGQKVLIVTFRYLESTRAPLHTPVPCPNPDPVCFHNEKIVSQRNVFFISQRNFPYYFTRL
jgi:hypothetical protein